MSTNAFSNAQLKGLLPMDERSWQPIDTAPIGVAVLCAEPNCDHGVAILILLDCYGPTVQHPDNPDGLAGRLLRGIEHSYEWRDNSGDRCQDYRPTHWMPLPELPDSASGGQ